jgi:hypothetical protein
MVSREDAKLAGNSKSNPSFASFAASRETSDFPGFGSSGLISGRNPAVIPP